MKNTQKTILTYTIIAISIYLVLSFIDSFYKDYRKVECNKLLTREKENINNTAYYNLKIDIDECANYDVKLTRELIQ